MVEAGLERMFNILITTHNASSLRFAHWKIQHSNFMGDIIITMVDILLELNI